MNDTDFIGLVAGLEDTAFYRMLARLLLIRATVRYRKEHALSDLQAQKQIAQQYAERTAPVEPWVYQVYDSVSARTLRRWEESVRDGGMLALVDSYGKRSERDYDSYFGPKSKLRRLAMYHLADNPECTASDVLDVLSHEVSKHELPDLRTVQRFLSKVRG